VRLLLDTNALIWTLVRRERLSPIAIDAIEDESNDVFVSVVSAWEIEIKSAKGKLEAPSDLQGALGAQGFKSLAVTMAHAYAVESLPRHHRDPFDRMIVAQAHLEGMTIVTSDRDIRHYPVAVLEATRRGFANGTG
jgi:PIN domain nuclease of toxin-antitoxin system